MKSEDNQATKNFESNGKDKEQIITSPLEQLVTYLFSLQYSPLGLNSKDLISNHYSPEILSKGSFFYTMEQAEDNSFLTKDEKLSLSHMAHGEVISIHIPPEYGVITSLLSRAEKVTIEKINSVYQRDLQEIARLVKLSVQKEISNLEAISAGLEFSENTEQREQQIDTCKEEINLLLQSKKDLLEKI